MTDVSTDVPGAKIRRLQGDNYVVVFVSVMFAGVTPTILGLARRMHLQTDLVFHVLLGYHANADVVRQLYRDQIGTPVPKLDVARRELRILGTTATLNADFPAGTLTPYLIWGVKPGGRGVVVLPLSAGFRSVMRQATEQRIRETRLQAIKPAFDVLEREVHAIREKARDLAVDIKVCKSLAERHAREIAILEALDGLLGTMLTFPKESIDADDRRDVEQLRTRLGTLKAEAHRHMILDPPDTFRAGLIRQRDRNARELRVMFEAPEFVEHVRALIANRDIAPPQLWQRLLDAVDAAVQAALGSPESDHFLDAHVAPAIDTLASRPFDLAGLSAPSLPELDRALREVPVAPPANSVLVILLSGAGVVPSSVGNYPGPNTLAVSILEVAAPLLMARVVGNVQVAGTMAGRLYRALVTSASMLEGTGQPSLNLAERVALIEAIDQGNLQRLRDVNWSSRFMSSRAWGSAIAIASVICLVAAVQSDDASTLRRWSNILSSGTGTALGVAVVVGRYSTLVQQGIVRGAAGKALGVIGGVAAIVSGVVTAQEEFETGDRVGAVISITGAVGGGLAVAGFLVVAGLGATATIFGAPAGVVLMAAGAIVGIGAAIFGAVRTVRAAGTQVVFEAMINHVGRDFGPLDSAADERASLRAAFEAVQASHHGVDFWDVHPDKIPELFDLGFSEEHIVHVVDEEEAVVRNSLRRSKHIE